MTLELEGNINRADLAAGAVLPPGILSALERRVCSQILVPHGRLCRAYQKIPGMAVPDNPRAEGDERMGLGPGIWAPTLLLSTQDYDTFMTKTRGVLRSIPNDVEDLWSECLAEQLELLNRNPAELMAQHF